MKKSSVFISIFWSFALLASCSLNNNSNTSDDTEPEYVSINSVDDFEKMCKDHPYNSTYKGMSYYTLETDLDFKGAHKQYNLKNVIFKGNDHIIKNYSINVASYSGLFDHIDNCSFEKLTIKNATVYGGYAGSFVGYANKALFDTIKIDSSVVVGDGVSDVVGGLVGDGQEIDVRSCENNANIKGVKSVGGIAGYAYNSDVSYCVNNGKISALNGANVGGIVGKYAQYWRYDAHTDLFLENVNNGEIDGTASEKVGGLVGFYAPDVYNGDLEKPSFSFDHCSNNADVTGSNYVGGIMGYGVGDLNDITFSSSVNKGTIKGKRYVGGISGYSDISSSSHFALHANCVNELNADKSNYVQGEYYVGGIAGFGLSFRSCTNNTPVKLVLTNDPIDSNNMVHKEKQYGIGGICGSTYGTDFKTKCEFSDVTNNGDVLGVDDGEHHYKMATSIGGIVGLTCGGSFIRCTNKGLVDGYRTAGGIIGALFPVVQTTCSELKNEGSMNVSDYSGGLIGYININSNNMKTVSIGTSTTDIEAKLWASGIGFYFGGLIGDVKNSYGNYSSAYGNVIVANCAAKTTRYTYMAMGVTCRAVIGNNEQHESSGKYMAVIDSYTTSNSTVVSGGNL